MNAPTSPKNLRPQTCEEVLAWLRQSTPLPALPNIHAVSPQQHDLDDAKMWRWLIESADRQGGARIYPKDEHGGRRYAFGNPDEV